MAALVGFEKQRKKGGKEEEGVHDCNCCGLVLVGVRESISFKVRKVDPHRHTKTSQQLYLKSKQKSTSRLVIARKLNRRFRAE